MTRHHAIARRELETGPAVPPRAVPPSVAWAREREVLLEMLAQQQRVSQAGLVTSGVAHEIHNHASVISGLATLALAADDPDEWRETLTQVAERARILSETTQTIMDFVRRREGVTDRRFCAADVVRKARRLTQPLVLRTNCTIGVDAVEQLELSGDPNGLVQALVNLISNAVRACGEDEGRVALSVRRRGQHRCCIDVSDNGPGIPAQLRGMLFRPFATGNADRGGNGIGLFIVRQTVRKIGGRIRMSTSPRGTTFTLDVPLAAAVSKEAHEAA